MPTSEEAVERTFSKHRLVHTEVRSKLRPETVEKVLFIRYNVCLVHENLHFDKAKLDAISHDDDKFDFDALFDNEE